MENEEMAWLAYLKGYEFEQKYHVCAQCALAALQETIGGIDDNTFQAVFTLGGGGGLTREGTCGALVAGMLAIGSRFGRTRANFGQKSDRTAFRIAKRLADQFYEEFGSYTCRGVQTSIFGRSFDFWNEAENKAFKDAGAHEDKCPRVVGKGAQMAVKIILEEESMRKT
jgi:C_GCAxxG_C_C family probable redox protein